MRRELSRRQTLGGMAIGLLGSTAASRAAAQPGQAVAGVCRLFPQAVEGPYYFDPILVRGDIAEGRAGVPLVLTLRVIDMGPCTPLSGARVDVWHADPLGIYSGYPGQGAQRDLSTVGKTFLRGTQMTDAQGEVTFSTIYPGWYPGRTPHIHLKVFLDKTRLVTGQIYFLDELSARIYTSSAPYVSRGPADTKNAQDGIFSTGEREGGGIVVTVGETGTPLRASLVIAVDRTGEAAGRAGGWRGTIRRTLGL